ncbi:MAG: DUF1569 domain-containing protein [Bacteroidota bacterium]
MAVPNIFEKETLETVKNRIRKLTNSTPAVWGKMNVTQMLAHCNVTYEMIFTEKHSKPNFFMKLMLNLFVKSKVIGESSYAKNSPTGPQFIITDIREFENEQTRLLSYLDQVFELGSTSFEGKESNSFGVLTAREWNNMMYKHLDHHLSQFGV